MITIYFGNDDALNKAIKYRLNSYQLDYQEFTSNDIDHRTLISFLCQTTDMFNLLAPKLMVYKLDNRLTISQFIKKILADRENCLRLPLVVTDKGIFPGLTLEEVGTLFPKEVRKAERFQLLQRLKELDKGRLFWCNFERFRKQSELRWFEIYDLLFPKAINDLTTIKANRDRLHHYQKTRTVPPTSIVQKLADIFLVDYDDFFQKSVLDLQMINK
ncbi:hypothetical protein [Streptococcus ferus]|uniref:hypothetical protein n=1 Tax=Streptococcus ferus TaxID=1345 RepID=UPI00359F4002